MLLDVPEEGLCLSIQCADIRIAYRSWGNARPRLRLTARDKGLILCEALLIGRTRRGELLVNPLEFCIPTKLLCSSCIQGIECLLTLSHQCIEDFDILCILFSRCAAAL